MKIYAHRGWSGQFPENTLLAFQHALALGVDGIELDVHATAEGIPVVIHDRSLGRTTSGVGNVDEQSLAFVRSLDAGLGERVPLLDELLREVGHEVHLDIEVKGLGIEANVLDVLARYPRARWAISSFNWETLRRLRALDSDAVLWPLATDVDHALVAVSREFGSPAVSLLAANYTATSAKTLRDAGLQTMIWTVNYAVEAKRVRNLGAFALCTDDPGQMIAALRG